MSSNKMTKQQRLQAHKRQHVSLMVQNTLIICVVLCVFAFFGYSVTKGMIDRHTESYYVNTTAFSDYMSGLDVDVEETEDTASDTDGDVDVSEDVESEEVAE